MVKNLSNTRCLIFPLCPSVVDGNLVKVLSWYDNEMGYTHSLVEHVVKMAEMCKTVEK